MCYVIITCRSVLWTLLSILLFVTVLSCGFSTKWLESAPAKVDAQGHRVTSTIGLFSTCQLIELESGLITEKCNLHATSISDFSSPYWVACCFFIGLALLLLTIVTIFAFGALCFRSLGRKSIYSVSGLLQAVSGFIMLFPPVLFPLGWSSDLVKHHCGDTSYYFNMGTCSIGIAYLGIILSLFAAFALSILSKYADSSMRCRKIEHDIDHGKNPICGGF